MTGKKHKIYVVSTSACDFVKIGYTGSTLISGVWKSYRRAYGEDMIIHRIFPAERRLEDLEIHRRLLPKYGMPEKGNEIYRKEHLSQLIRELCDWHSHPGYGPYRKSDLARFRVSHHTHLSQPPSSRSEKYPPYDIALRNPKKEAEHNIHDRTRASVAHQTKMKVSGGNSRNLPLRERNTLKVHPPISVENEFEVSYSPVHEITLLLKETL